MTFPAKFFVDHYPYIGNVTDELGNVIEAWDDPTSRAAQGWRSIAHERLGNNTQGLVDDVMLSLPPDWVPALHDRIGLPDGVYEVTGFRMQDSGFHGWQPGNVVLLKRATGII